MRIMADIQRHPARQENHINQPRSTIGSRELDDLRRELEMERGLRQKATERAEAADESLKQEVTTRLHAQAMAQERVRYAQTQEVDSLPALEITILIN